MNLFGVAIATWEGAIVTTPRSLRSLSDSRRSINGNRPFLRFIGMREQLLSVEQQLQETESALDVSLGILGNEN